MGWLDVVEPPQTRAQTPDTPCPLGGEQNNQSHFAGADLPFLSVGHYFLHIAIIHFLKPVMMLFETAQASYIVIHCCAVSILVSCPRPYFSEIGSGTIAYIELFQQNSIIIVNITTKASLFHNHVKNAKTYVTN